MTLYLSVCLAIFVIMLGLGIYSDYVHGPDSKFGYAYKSKMYWFFIGVTSIPFVNLLTLAYLIHLYIDQYRQK